MSHTKFGPDGSAVLTFIGHKKTDRQAKFIYRCTWREPNRGWKSVFSDPRFLVKWINLNTKQNCRLYLKGTVCVISSAKMSWLTTVPWKALFTILQSPPPSLDINFYNFQKRNIFNCCFSTKVNQNINVLSEINSF